MRWTYLIRLNIKINVKRFFNYNDLDLKFFKQQYDTEVKRKEERRWTWTKKKMVH